MKTKTFRIINILIVIFSFTLLNSLYSQTDKAEMTVPSDSEILTIINAINQNEINIAEMVQKKQISFPVMEYAQMLFKEHTDNMTKANELSAKLGLTPAPTSTSEEIIAKGSEELSTLSSKSESDLETAYLDAMISGHTRAVDMIDGWLAAGVTNEDIKNFLMDTRSHVQMHLEEARKLR